MTGDSGLYTTSDGVYCYTGVNTSTVYVFKGTDTGNVYITTSWLGTNGYTYEGSITRYDSMKGGATRYKRTAAGNITLTGTSSEITLDSSTDDQNPIEITITGATVS